MKLGYYAYYPTLLEPAPGPWGGREIFDLHPVEAWRRILHWLKEREIDYVVAVVSPKFRDNIYHDWPFAYLCDYPDYPEARIFPSEVIEHNRSIVNEIVSYADSLGIDIYLKHFNFYAPRGFIEAHPEIREKYRRTRGAGVAGHDSCNFLNTLYGNICWNEPVYQAFMKASWAEIFAMVPGVKGLMVTPGEHNACSCALCQGTDPAKAARKEAKGRMLINFITTFCKEMERLNKDSLVRTWNVHHYEGDMPKATAWFPKYHVFDCFDAPMDPQTAALADRVDEPVHYMFVQNGENAAHSLWFKPDYWRRIGQALRQKQAGGAIIMHNIDWGMNGMTHPASQLNFEAFFRYVRNPEDPIDWRERVVSWAGAEAAPGVLTALEKMAAFPMDVTKILFLGSEGYTYGPVQPCDAEFAPDPWGVLARNWTPPAWARGEVGLLKDYWEHLGEDAFVSFEMLAEKTAMRGERCPIGVMEEIIQDLKQAIALIDGLLPDVSRELRGSVHTLAVNARMICAHTRMLTASIKTALLIRAARCTKESERQAELALAALREHIQALNALKEQVSWLNAHPHDFIDYRNWLRLAPPPFNSYQAIQFTPLAMVEREHRNLRRWVEEIAGVESAATVPEPGCPSLTAMPPVANDSAVWRKE